MGDHCELMHGMRVLKCDGSGPKVCCERDAADLVNEAFNAQARVIAIPVERLSDDFFTLSTRVAGEVVQKIVNYGMRLAVVGDISRYLNRSEPLRDWVRESNRGSDIWFVEDFVALDERLETRPAAER